MAQGRHSRSLGLEQHIPAGRRWPHPTAGEAERNREPEIPSRLPHPQSALPMKRTWPPRARRRPASWRKPSPGGLLGLGLPLTAVSNAPESRGSSPTPKSLPHASSRHIIINFIPYARRGTGNEGHSDA